VTRFFVQGHPVPQGSKRHVGGGRMVEQANIKPWRLSIAWEASQLFSEPLEGPVVLDLLFSLKRPKGHYGTGRNAGVLKPRCVDLRPVTRPDVDKLCRAVGDALTGVAYRDDSQVVDLIARKVYAEGHEGVRIEVHDG